MFLVKDFKGFTIYEKAMFGLFLLVQVGILFISGLRMAMLTG